MPGTLITVDRPGPRGYVVVQDEREREAVLPSAWFPEKPQEGSVFRLSLKSEEGLTAQRRDEVQSLIKDLTSGEGDEGGDDTEEL